MTLSNLIRAFVSKVWSEPATDPELCTKLLGLCHALDDGNITSEKACSSVHKILLMTTTRPSIDGIERFISKITISSSLQQLQTSPHLAACLAIIEQYDDKVHFLSTSIRLDIKQHSGYSTVRLFNHDKFFSPEVMVLFSAGLLSIFDRICDCKIALRGIVYPHSFKNNLAFIAPSYLYDCDVQYHGENVEMQFHTCQISSPSVFYQPSVFRTWIGELKNALNETEIMHPVTNKVRACLENSKEPARLKLEEIADSLNKSVTHLRRLLKYEGTSFRYYASKIVAYLAMKRLMLNEPIDTVAIELGYSERTAFERFIKKFLGVKAVIIKRVGVRLHQPAERLLNSSTIELVHRSKGLALDNLIQKYFGELRSAPDLKQIIVDEKIIQLCEKTICDVELSSKCYFDSPLLSHLVKCLMLQLKKDQSGSPGLPVSEKTVIWFIKTHISLFIGMSLLLKKSHPDAKLTYKTIYSSRNWTDFCFNYKQNTKVGFYDTCAVKMAEYGFPADLVEEVAYLDKKVASAISDPIVDQHQHLMFSFMNQRNNGLKPKIMYQRSA